MAKPTLTAIDPQGHIHTRKTDRTYTHVVFARITEANREEWRRGQAEWPNQSYYTRSLAYAAAYDWFPPTWHSRLDLAAKEAAKSPGSVIVNVEA